MHMQKRLIGLAFMAAALPGLAFAADTPATVAAIVPAPLADAVMNKDFPAMRALIKRGADVKTPQADGSTALHWAAYWDDAEAADLLLKAGADPKAATRLGATPMSIATEDGDTAMIRRLLAAGVDANAPFLSNGETPLMLAARSGSVESVQLLLEAGANVEAKDTLRQTTALIWAAEQGHAKVVALLLAHHADPAASSKVTVPPARRPAPAAAAAAGAGGAGAAAAAADDEPADPAVLAPTANAKGGITALMVATREKATDTMTVLLDAGAPINQQTGNGSTALLVALENGDAARAKLLIDRGADVSLANGKGWTPLYLAVKARTREKGTVPNPVIDTAAMLDVVKLLVEKGADVNARLKANTDLYGATSWLKEAGATAFLRAAYCGDLEVLQYLLAHGADPKIATNDGTTALMALAGVGYGDGFTTDFGTPEQSLEAMKLLIDSGIPVNAVNSEKIAALHGAAHKNFVLGIQYLVDHGADLTMKSQHASSYERMGSPGNTVLDWATGIQVNLQSSTYKKEAVELVTKLMKERNIPLEGLTTTKGGLAAGQK
jgi:ankyrin repeat protein